MTWQVVKSSALRGLCHKRVVMLARCRAPLRSAMHALCRAPHVGLCACPSPAQPRRGLSLPRAAAGPSDIDELFGDAAPAADGLGPQSRTASKKRSEEFRRLGRELVTLPAKTLNRMALPSDLMEAVEEVTDSSTASTGDSRTPQHMRIESRRGVGSTKKGRARVEALMAQILRSYEPARSARIEAATRLALAGEVFAPVEPRGSTDVMPKAARAAVADEAAAGVLARQWVAGLVDGEVSVASDVFQALTQLGDAWMGPDRVELRQMVAKTQVEARAALDAAAAAALAAAAAAAAGETVHAPPRAAAGKAAKALLAALTPLARAASASAPETAQPEADGA